MVRLSGSQIVVESLRREKVDVIFGFPGGAIMPVYDSLFDSDIRHILARHEQSAAHMADGYARVSGKIGVCMATSGPGATNLVTGIANAFMDSSPIAAITGQVATPFIGKDAFQEADIIGISTPITKYNFQPRKTSEIPTAIKKAFEIAMRGRPGPVLIDLPKDVQTNSAEVEFPKKVEILGHKLKKEPHLLQVDKAAKMLLNAERPMIMAGGGVNISNANKVLLRIAELLVSPVITTLMGKGSFPEDHPLSLGLIGMHGKAAANKLVLESDVLLAVGVRFSDRSTGNVEEFAKDTKIIQIDIDPSEIGKNKLIDLPIVGDVNITLRELQKALVKKIVKKKKTVWQMRMKEVKESFNNRTDSKNDLIPANILKKLREILPTDAIIATEVGQNQMWAALYFTSLKPRTFLTSGGLGTMGFGFPAAIGAKVAKPDVPVIDIAGDGSFRMTENSLATSVSEKIPVIVVILNNSVLGMVAQWQRMFYNRRYSATKLGNIPDFKKLTESYGAQGFCISSIKEFEKVIKSALRDDITTVIDIPISSEENVFPMVPPSKGLKDVILD
jgi:acetolactate synthase-1/2/3 large subunit